MKSKKGFTLVEIMIVVAIIGLLAAIAIPSLLKARQETQRKLIINNLRLIEDARDQVMTSSNYVSYGIVSVPMVNPYLKAGSIIDMGWPGSIPGIDDFVLTNNAPVPTDAASIENFYHDTDPLTAHFEIVRGTREEITTGRGSE